MKLVYVLFKLKEFNCRVLCKTDCLFLDCSSVISMFNSFQASLYLFNRLVEVFRFTGNIVGLGDEDLHVLEWEGVLRTVSIVVKNL